VGSEAQRRRSVCKALGERSEERGARMGMVELARGGARFIGPGRRGGGQQRWSFNPRRF
jgi:hypothetical protein